MGPTDSPPAVLGPPAQAQPHVEIDPPTGLSPEMLPSDFPWTTPQAAAHGPDVIGGKGFFALCAAILWPGAGHLIAGYPSRALLWTLLVPAAVAAAVSALIYPPMVAMLVVLLPLAAVLQLVHLFDAIYCGRHSSRPILGDPAFHYVGGFVLVVGALIWQHAAANYLLNNYVEICYSPTPSMSPAITPDDHFLERRNWPFARWDIVTLISPDPRYSQMLKRVVGLPGETVEITGDGLLINGKLMLLPSGVPSYAPLDNLGHWLGAPDPVNAGTGCWGNPIHLAADEYFVLGDYSERSEDSRFWPSINGHQPGALPRNQIVGRVVAILWPPERWRCFVH